MKSSKVIATILIDIHIFLGKREEQFVLSRVGKVCENSIDKKEICITSANQFSKIEFMVGNGTGVDLPKGCILDKTNEEHHYVFWNPNGVAISEDPKIREICFENEDPLEGKILTL